MTPLLLLVATVSPAQPAPPTEAIDARQVAAWVADLSATDAVKQQAALKALIKAGPQAKAAVPDLVKMLGDKNRNVYEVVDILGAIGPDARDAIPALVVMAKPGGYGGGFLLDSVALALVKIEGPKLEAARALLLTPSKGHDISLVGSRYLNEYTAKVVPQVVELCADKDAEVRMKAATLLGSLRQPVSKDKTLLDMAGDGAKNIPATLEKLLADDDVNVRLSAASAIANVAPQLAEKTIPVVVAAMDIKLGMKGGYYNAVETFRSVPEPAAKALIPLLDSDRDSLRWWAINTLSSLPVQDQLITALKDGKTLRMREAAAITLGSRGSAPEPAITALKAALADKDFPVRFAAAQSLVNIWGRAPDVSVTIPVLIEGLKQDNEDTRLTASKYLLSVGTAAKTAVPDLKRLLADKNDGIALEAALALTEIDITQTAEAIPVLTAGLAGNDSSTLRSAKALSKIGANAKSAVPELVKKFDAKNVLVRISLVEAVARIDPTQAGKATAVLVALLKDPKNKNGMVREQAAFALMRMGPAGKTAAPTLLELFGEKGSFQPELALAAVAVDPQAAKLAVAWIRERLSPDCEDYYDIVNALPEMGPAAKPFLPELLTMLQSKTPYFREHAAKALGGIGPDAREALPLLQEIAKTEKRPNTRKMAEEAIRKISD